MSIKGHVDYSTCGPAPKPVVAKERVQRIAKQWRGIPWSDEEKQRLRNLCAVITPEEAVKHFPNRNYRAISHMVSVLKIERLKVITP